MKGVGDAEIHDPDGRIVEERAMIVVHLRDAVAARQLLGTGPGLAGNRDNLYRDSSHLLVGPQVKRGRESGPHHTHFH
jgi:hypothetical protein